jgi:signal transduction histidine kinase
MEIIAKSLGVQSAFFFASSITGGTRLTLVGSWPQNTPARLSHIDYQKFCWVNTGCTQGCDGLSGIPQCIFAEPKLPLSDRFTQEIRSENVPADLVCASATVCSTKSIPGTPHLWGALVCFAPAGLSATKIKSLHGFAKTIIHSLSKNLLTSWGGLGRDTPLNTLQYNDALYRLNQLFSGGKVVRISWELGSAGFWNVCSISKNAGEVIGYEPQEILGRNFADVVCAEDLEGFLGEASGAITRNIRSWEQKYRIVGAEGEVRHLYGYVRVASRGALARSSILLDGLLLDIADEVKSHNNLEKTLQSLEWFTHAASHDLKEPTNTIVGRLRMATREIDTLVKASKANTITGSQVIDVLVRKDSHSISYLVHRSLLAAKRLGLLMDDLLSYSRISGHLPEMSLFRSSEAIDSALDGLAEAINKSNAQIQILSEMPQIYVDRYKFEVLVQNLIENSIKFIKPDSYPEIFISCQLKMSETASTLTLATARQKYDWQFTVADNGIGFDAATEGKKILQPFGRLHSFEQYEGTGLGLASCQKIVSLWGGALWADAIPGEGASFSFTVPSSFNPS